MCFTLGRKAFMELLGPIEDVWRFEALRKVPVLFALQEKQLFDLARCMKTHAIAADQMVFRQGDPGAHRSPSASSCLSDLLALPSAWRMLQQQIKATLQSSHAGSILTATCMQLLPMRVYLSRRRCMVRWEGCARAQGMCST